MMRRKIVYFKVWWNNIGNAFIDLGAQYAIGKAISGMDFYLIGGGIVNLLRYVTNWKLRLIKKILPGSVLNRIRRNYPDLKYILYTPSSYSDAFDLVSIINADYVIFSGMVLNKWFLQIVNYIFQKLKNKESKIIFLGCGGAHYTEDEFEYVSNFLKEIKPYALISRDEWTYRNYYTFAEYSYNGIDCGFYISDFFPDAKKLKLDIPEYIVLNFDTLKEPKEIGEDNKYIIRVHHSYYHDREIKNILKTKDNSNIFISDNPYDYFILYANAKEVHSDRVHACVVSLSYGTTFKLYLETPRALLFKRIGIDPYEKVNSLDYLSKLQEEKKRQIKFLSEILE